MARAKEKSGTWREMTSKMPPDRCKCQERHAAGRGMETGAEGSSFGDDGGLD